VINTIIIEVVFIDAITVTVTAHVIIGALPDSITEAIITHAILEAILGTILLDERSGSVAGRLEGDSPVLVARVDGADAGDLPRSQDASDCASRRDLQNSEVTSRFVKGSQLLAVSKSLTANNFASRLSGTHFTVLSGAQLELGPHLGEFFHECGEGHIRQTLERVEPERQNRGNEVIDPITAVGCVIELQPDRPGVARKRSFDEQDEVRIQPEKCVDSRHVRPNCDKRR
jgi:hypothetical protein